MKKFSNFICKHKGFIVTLTLLLLIPSFIGMKMTKINYDILVYLPEDIETVKGQNILSEDFNMGAFSITSIENMSSKDILKLESKIKQLDGVAKVISAYDVIGSTIPLEMLPSEITSKVKSGNTDLLLITYEDSTSSETTLQAVEEVKKITEDSCKVGGMSAMVLDTMNLSEKEIAIYIVIAVLLCILVLEISLDSYIVPFILLLNIGISILFNLGTNIIFGDISYITKALVAVLQLGVTTDFSIFLYHAYENKKQQYRNKEEAMSNAIVETMTSVVGSSLTTIAGFLVLCTMQLTLGKDLGLVMAKGVFLGVICVLTIFPSLLLVCDRWVEKTKHKSLSLKFEALNRFIIKHYKKIFAIFILLLIPAYLANSKIDIYYKLDETLPKNLDSIMANQELADTFNIVSPEIILLDKNIIANDVTSMIAEIEKVEGVDFILSFQKLANLGISKEMLSKDVIQIFESEKYQMLLLNSTYGIATDELNEQIGTIQEIIKKYDENAILAGEGPLMKDLINVSDTDFKNVNTSSIICILIIMVFVLKSYTLPILLIAAIEFAIFINMSIPYFMDISLPFVAPIVLGTIQLGATIDYAILMTTTYLKHRQQGIEKKEAMRLTMSNCTSSILVSGLCFFAATFGVGIYSELEMISSLCTLISRGALISMFVVIIVLPSILLLFDGVICKTTIGLKKESKNMKKRIQKLATLVLLFGISLQAIPVFALTKEETVYSKLNADGSVQKTLVNEHLINEEQLEELKDNTDLRDIVNLNGEESFEWKDQTLTWKANGNDIFYQGTTEKELPILLTIKYYLDGEEQKLEDILGKSGKVTIQMHYENKDAHMVYVNGKRETLYTPFVVTMATMFDSNNNSNIEVSNGKIVNNGSKNIVVALATPGLYESMGISNFKDMDTITISFDTKKFELSSIYSMVTSKLIDQEDLKVFDKLDNLSQKTDLLQDSINKLEEGSKALLMGTGQLDDSTKLLYESLTTIVEKLKALETGTVTMNESIQRMLPELAKIDFDKNIATLSTLIEKNQAVYHKIEQSKNTYEAFKQAYETTTKTDLTPAMIMTFTKETYASFGITGLTEEQANAKNIELIVAQSTYETNVQLLSLLEGNITALNSSLTLLQTLQQSHLENLGVGVKTISDGTTQLRKGMEVLTEKVQQLSIGTHTLYNGTNELYNGINLFNRDGIQVLTGYTKSAQNIKEKLDVLLQLADEYDTFTMKSKEDKGSTRFVLTIDAVKVKENKDTSEQPKEKVTLWTKIKNLFK